MLSVFHVPRAKRTGACQRLRKSNSFPNLARRRSRLMRSCGNPRKRSNSVARQRQLVHARRRRSTSTTSSSSSASDQMHVDSLTIDPPPWTPDSFWENERAQGMNAFRVARQLDVLTTAYAEDVVKDYIVFPVLDCLQPHVGPLPMGMPIPPALQQYPPTFAPVPTPVTTQSSSFFSLRFPFINMSNSKVFGGRSKRPTSLTDDPRFILRWHRDRGEYQSTLYSSSARPAYPAVTPSGFVNNVHPSQPAPHAIYSTPSPSLRPPQPQPPYLPGMSAYTNQAYTFTPPGLGLRPPPPPLEVCHVVKRRLNWRATAGFKFPRVPQSLPLYETQVSYESARYH